MTGEENLNKSTEIVFSQAKLRTNPSLAMDIASQIRRRTDHVIGTPDPSIESSLVYLMREPDNITDSERILREELVSRAAKVLGFELVPVSEEEVAS